MHKTNRMGSSEHREQSGMGNKVKIKSKTGRKGKERLNERLCTIELGRKEEWEAVVDEEQGNQSRRKIHVNRKRIGNYFCFGQLKAGFGAIKFK